MGTKVNPRAVRPNLPERFSDYVFIRSAARAAAREFSVHYHGRQTSNTQLLGPGRSFTMLHVMNTNLVIGAGDLFDQIDRFLARCTARAIDLNGVPSC